MDVTKYDWKYIPQSGLCVCNKRGKFLVLHPDRVVVFSRSGRRTVAGDFAGIIEQARREA